MPTTKSAHPTNWLRVARHSRRLTQRELAQLAGSSRISIVHHENERVTPSYASQRAIAQALGYRVGDLFPPPGKRSPSPELRAWAKALNGRARR